MTRLPEPKIHAPGGTRLKERKRGKSGQAAYSRQTHRRSHAELSLRCANLPSSKLAQTRNPRSWQVQGVGEIQTRRVTISARSGTCRSSKRCAGAPSRCRSTTWTPRAKNDSSRAIPIPVRGPRCGRRQRHAGFPQAPRLFALPRRRHRRHPRSVPRQDIGFQTSRSFAGKTADASKSAGTLRRLLLSRPKPLAVTAAGALTRTSSAWSPARRKRNLVPARSERLPHIRGMVTVRSGGRKIVIFPTPKSNTNKF